MADPRANNAAVPVQTDQLQTEPPWLDRAADQGQAVRDALALVLNSMPSPSCDRKGRPRIPGLNATVNSRLVRAIEASDPLVALYHLPGPDALRKVLDRARSLDADASACAHAATTVDALDRFFSIEGIERETLFAMLADRVPEARAAMVRSSFQLQHKASAALLGYEARAASITVIVQPDGDGQTCTMTGITMMCGLRRLRASALYHDRGYAFAEQDRPQVLRQRSIEGIPLAELDRPPIIHELCDPAPPAFARVESPVGVTWRLLDQPTGRAGELSYAMGLQIPRAAPLIATPEQDLALIPALSVIPARLKVFDVLLAPGVWEQSPPWLEAYRVVADRPVDASNRSARQHDRIELGMTLSPVLGGIDALTQPTMPNHRAALEMLLRATGTEHEQLRGWRHEVRHPPAGIQFAQVFSLPRA